MVGHAADIEAFLIHGTRPKPKVVK
jgi:hypothetical protein